MASSTTGQVNSILAGRDCPFGARDDISLRARQVHESFPWQNVFRDSKNFFSDFSVGMKLETRKPNAPSLLPSLLHVTTILVVFWWFNVFYHQFATVSIIIEDLSRTFYHEFWKT